MKRFWSKIFEVQKNDVFWGLGGENFEHYRREPPRKSIPTETRRLTQNRRQYSQKCVLQSLARNQKPKKINKKTFEHHISPLCRGGPAGPIFTIIGVWGQTADVIIHIKFHVDCTGFRELWVPKIRCSH